MGSPEDDDSAKESGSTERAIPSGVEARRIRLSGILETATRQEVDNFISKAHEYAVLVIRGLARIVRELQRIQSPRQLDERLRIYLIGAVGEDKEIILRAPKKLVEDIVLLLKEIQTIEERATEDERDKNYERIIRKPLTALIAGLESGL
jgi:hypothetical protein